MVTDLSVILRLSDQYVFFLMMDLLSLCIILCCRSFCHVSPENPLFPFLGWEPAFKIRSPHSLSAYFICKWTLSSTNLIVICGPEFEDLCQNNLNFLHSSPHMQGSGRLPPIKSRFPLNSYLRWSRDSERCLLHLRIINTTSSYSNGCMKSLTNVKALYSLFILKHWLLALRIRLFIILSG